jgi:hypothetical protein
MLVLAVVGARFCSGWSLHDWGEAVIYVNIAECMGFFWLFPPLEHLFSVLEMYNPNLYISHNL